MLKFCTIDDYDAINQIHLSRRSIYGVPKTSEYLARYPTIVRSVLRNLKQDHSILGYYENDQLVSYGILWMPNNLPWWFLKHIEARKQDTETIQEGVLPPIFNLMQGIIEQGDAQGKYQGFFAFPAKSFKGIFKYKDTFEPFRNRAFLLHSLVDRNWILRTQIEVALLAKPLIPKIKTMGVFEVSLKEEYRFDKFPDLK